MMRRLSQFCCCCAASLGSSPASSVHSAHSDGGDNHQLEAVQGSNQPSDNGSHQSEHGSHHSSHHSHHSHHLHHSHHSNLHQHASQPSGPIHSLEAEASIGGDSGSGSDSDSSVDSTYIDPSQLLRLRDHGAQRRRWLEDPSEAGCFVLPSTLEYQTLLDTYDINWPVGRVEYWTITEYHRLRIQQDVLYNSFACVSDEFTWWGWTAPGLIMMEGIRRTANVGSIQPQISDVSLAVYKRDHTVDTLSTIRVNLVENPETFSFIRNHLYGDAFGLMWPDSGEQVWDEDSFHQLLGTRIGKVVAYTVLGAFPRGTRCIARVWTVPSSGDNSVHMRFDIEDAA